MKRILLVCLLLALTQAAQAATPQELWENYQHSITIDAPAPAPAPAATPTPPLPPSKIEISGPGYAPVISETPLNAPINAAPQTLLPHAPVTHEFMRTPQAGDFAQATSPAGYSIMLPKAFGSDPLADLPQAQGAMLVRTADDDLMCAATMLDPADVESFAATTPLPEYENKHVYANWEHGTAPIWKCSLARHDDYHGDKLLLEAQTELNGKTYQLLFVLPHARRDELLPQALYALESVKIK